MSEIGFYKNAPVYDPIVEMLLGIVWLNQRGRATPEMIKGYILSHIGASIVDIYCPLDALVRLGYSEAKARQMLRDEDLEELI